MNSCRLGRFVFWALMLSGTHWVFAGEAIQYTQNTVEFMAVGRPGLIKIKGNGEKMAKVPSARYSAEKGIAFDLPAIFAFHLDSLDTGIEKRDQHMKDRYLEVQRFPVAILTLVEPLSIKLPSVEVPFSGKLNLHGVERMVQGKVNVSQEGDQWAARADFQIQLSDFSIQVPAFAGVTVAENVGVRVQLAGKLK